MLVMSANRPEEAVSFKAEEHHPGQFVLRVTEPGFGGLGDKILTLYMSEAEAVDLIHALASVVGREG